MQRVRIVAAVSIALLGLVGAAGTADAAPGPSVTGGGTGTLPPAFGEFAGDPVHFVVQARGVGTDGRGHFTVVHRNESGGLYGQFTGDITCVSVTGSVAVTTGVIRHSTFADFPDWNLAGQKVAITVADGEPNDAIGFDFEFFGSTIDPCESVLTFMPVEHGNFTVR